MEVSGKSRHNSLLSEFINRVLQSDNERLPILRNTLEVKDIREGKTGRLKAPSESPRENASN